MPNLLTDPGHESGDSAWGIGPLFGAPDALAFRTSEGARSGSWSTKLIGPSSASDLRAVTQAPASKSWVEVPYRSEVWVKQLVPGSPLVFTMTSIGIDLGGWDVAIVTDEAIERWSRSDSSSPPVLIERTPVDPAADFIRVALKSTPPADWVSEQVEVWAFVTPLVSTIFPGVPYSAGGEWLLDDWRLLPAQEDLMARSNSAVFTSNLKTFIESIDENIGAVFLAPQRWESENQISEAGGVLTIDTAGLFDGVDSFGKATRFWILEEWIEPAPLTNQSSQYKVNWRLTGFWGYRSDESVSALMKQAVVEILDGLMLRATELTELASGMGDGYMGYLREMPKQGTPVKPAMLVSGVPGHAVTIEGAYYEEVIR